jgi:tRNA (cmo5U34)-methyltransferase
MADSVERFYDSISGDYTEFVYRCVPRYDEMLSMLFAYLPEGFSPRAILELGCGTGNLTRLIRQRFPGSRLRAVDISGECIDRCRQRLGHADIEYVNADFRSLDFPQRSFDLIMSSIAIHHLEDQEKGHLFGQTALWLAPGGVFTFCDQFRGETDSLYEQHLETWKEFAFAQGASDEEWNMWMEHQLEHDHHASLPAHMDLLRSAGYSTVDCTWRYLLWAAIYAAKA